MKIDFNAFEDSTTIGSRAGGGAFHQRMVER